MIPERKATINGHDIKQYLWARELVVYVDNRAVDETFDEVCTRLMKEKQDA